MNDRLRQEFTSVLETLDRSDRACLASASPDLLRVAVEYDVTSLYSVYAAGHGEHDVVEERTGLVELVFNLHPEHPAVAPIVVARTPNLYNSHISDPERGGDALAPFPLVCMGPFDPQLLVADWVVAAFDLLRWARISTQNPLNEAAARFYRQESAKPGRFPVDTRSFWRDGDEPVKRPIENSRSGSSASLEVDASANPGLRIGAWRSAQ